MAKWIDLIVVSLGSKGPILTICPVRRKPCTTVPVTTVPTPDILKALESVKIGGKNIL